MESKSTAPYLILFTPRFKIPCCTRLNNIIRIFWIRFVCDLCGALCALEVESEYLNTQIVLQMIPLHEKKSDKYLRIHIICLSN